MDDALASLSALNWQLPGTALHLHLLSQDVADLAPFPGPSIDVGCGNGTFLFQCLGGRLNPANRAVVRPAGQRINVATDIDQPALDFAKGLDFYDTILYHDNNKLPFPFPDDHFRTMYCNTLYWVTDPLATARELHRILHPEGRALFHLMSPELERPYHELKAYLSVDRLDANNRFRLTIPYVRYYYSDWRRCFEQAGWSIVDARPVHHNRYLSQLMAVQMFFQGPLEYMKNYLPQDDLAEKAAIWGRINRELLQPLVEATPTVDLHNTPYMAFMLAKGSSTPHGVRAT